MRYPMSPEGTGRRKRALAMGKHRGLPEWRLLWAVMIATSLSAMTASGQSLDPPNPSSVRVSLVDSVDSRVQVYTSMATWCGACKKELPQFALLKRRFGPGEVGLYGIPVDPKDTPEMLRAYIERNEPAYELLRSLPRPAIEAFRQVILVGLGVDGLPASVVADARGQVLHVQAGVPSVSTLRRLLAGLEKKGPR